MSDPRRGLYWEEVGEGDLVTPVTLQVSYARVILSVAATRDFMRGHHDPAFAREQGQRDIYVNTLFHQAFVDRVMTDWAGPRAFIARRKIVMRGAICAGDTIVGEGRVTDRRRDDSGRGLIELDLRVSNGRELCCEALGVLALPGRDDG